MDTPKEETLRQLPYSELKKCAKKYGVKGSSKKNLISSILEKTRQHEDSFLALEQQIINSCKKHKEAKFDMDNKIVSDTPRRETYTIDCPLDSIMTLNKDFETLSASPTLKSLGENETMNVTLSRGSGKKQMKHKVSFITPIRRSLRLSTLTPQFASVKNRPKTPIPFRNSSGMNDASFTKEPYTPGVVQRSGTKKSKVSVGGKEKRPSTPMPQSKPKRMKLSSTGSADEYICTPVSVTTPSVATFLPSVAEKDAEKTPKPGVKPAITPCPLPKAKVTTPMHSKHVDTPGVLSNKRKPASVAKSGVKRAITPCSLPFAKAATPRSGLRSSATKATALGSMFAVQSTPASCPSSTKAKRAVPNFEKLHQKAFDKMESIDEYQNRKALNSAKKIKEQRKFHDPSKLNSLKNFAVKLSNAPKRFAGIPFIPSVTSTKDMKTNFASAAVRPNFTLVSGKNMTALKHESSLFKKGIINDENAHLKQKTKFDLRASLAKKLPYKPHSGPLKPLNDTILNNTMYRSSPKQPRAKEGVKTIKTGNKLTKAKRVQSREVLHGVRSNRRFQLQMQKRNKAST